MPVRSIAEVVLSLGELGGYVDGEPLNTHRCSSSASASRHDGPASLLPVALAEAERSL